MQAEGITLEQQDELLLTLAGFACDPLGFALWNYPWGEPGDLENEALEDWQVEILNNLGAGVLSVQEAIAKAQEYEVPANPIREARTSGHGVGKSAVVCIIMDWAQSTCVDMKGIVTANTENQLKTKTWAEFSKWHRLGISSVLFRLTATARFSIDPQHERTWRIDAVAWSEKNMEAFAGLHNKGRRILVVFDEASAIPDAIWETTEGALTDKNTEIIWVVFGNPTRNTGRFRECFPGGQFAHRWNSRAVDSREVRITNKKQIQEWIDDYGDDHDFVRVRVKGEFPRIDATSFISLDVVREACEREVVPTNRGIVLGLDVARFGNNASVIYPRKGRDARTLAPIVLQGLDTIALAAKVWAVCQQLEAVAIFADEGGVGGGVVDQLNYLGAPVYGIQFGGKADGYDPAIHRTKVSNKRAEMWASMEQWLHNGCIPKEIRGLDHSFTDELTAPTYTFIGEDTLQLESKKDMRRRNAPAVDAADALALTFAYPSFAEGPPGGGDPEYYTDPNPFAKVA